MRLVETFEHLYVYATAKIAVVQPTLGLCSRRGGAKGVGLHGARKSEAGSAGRGETSEKGLATRGALKSGGLR